MSTLPVLSCQSRMASDQSVNPANSEVVINCVAFFYGEGKGGGGIKEKKNKFPCLVKRGEKPGW